MDESATRLVAVVDDDASLRRSVRNLLVSVGLPVVTFPTAEAFLQSSQLYSTACLLLDLRMPTMSGLELLQILAEAGVRIPVVVLTGHGDDDARQRCLRAGAVAFLGKPFQGDVLINAIRSALRPVA